MSKIKLLRQDVEAHGEVHATVSEHDKELEIRKGTTTFVPDDDILRIREHKKTIVVDVDEIIDWYTPMEAWH